MQDPAKARASLISQIVPVTSVVFNGRALHKGLNTATAAWARLQMDVCGHSPDTSQGCRRSLRQAPSCHLSSGAQVQTDCWLLSDGALANYWNWPSGHPDGGSVSWQEDLKTRLCWGTPQRPTALWTGGKGTTRDCYVLRHLCARCSSPPCSPAGHRRSRDLSQQGGKGGFPSASDVLRSLPFFR